MTSMVSMFISASWQSYPIVSKELSYTWTKQECVARFVFRFPIAISASGYIMSEQDFVDRYKVLARDPSNHAEILKDVTFLQFLAYILHSTDKLLVKSALQTLQLFLQNKATHCVLNSTFGIVESIKHVSTRYVGEDDDLVELSKDVLNTLTCPAYGTRSWKRQKVKCENVNVRKLKTKVITLLVHGLSLERQTDLEAALVKLKEVVSFVVDAVHQRCTIRILYNATPKLIGEAIATKANMTAKLVTRNKFNQEVLVSIVGDTEENSDCDLPPYLPEESSPVRGKAVSLLGDLRNNACGMFKWFQNSFYW